MFERFYTAKAEQLQPHDESVAIQSEEEAAEIVENALTDVAQTTFESQTKTRYSPDVEINNPVKSEVEIEREKDIASNPHNFPELKK